MIAAVDIPAPVFGGILLAAVSVFVSGPHLTRWFTRFIEWRYSRREVRPLSLRDGDVGSEW